MDGRLDGWIAGSAEDKVILKYSWYDKYKWQGRIHLVRRLEKCFLG